jgi:hypothetical protein
MNDVAACATGAANSCGQPRETFTDGARERQGARGALDIMMRMNNSPHSHDLTKS